MSASAYPDAADYPSRRERRERRWRDDRFEAGPCAAWSPWTAPKPLLIAAQGRIGYSSIKAFEQAWAGVSQEKPVVATFGARNEVQGMVKNALSGRSTARAGEIARRQPKGKS